MASRQHSGSQLALGAAAAHLIERAAEGAHQVQADQVQDLAASTAFPLV